MLRENLSINITPGGVPVVIHISQYDIGLRTFVFTPYTTEGTFTADTAASATLEGTKPDGNAFVHNCSYNSSTGVITYTVQDQLAAVAGKVWSKLVIRNTSGKAIGYRAIIWVVDMAGVQDGAIVSDSDISALQEFIAEFGTINAYKAALDGALAAVGGPYVASTVAQMTDRTKVYVYTGSETGYTSGHWYYWNGSAWTDGGVYQAAAVETDKTLTVAGMAADAKATGDAVNDLESTLISEGTIKKAYKPVFISENTTTNASGLFAAGSSGTNAYVYEISAGTNIVVTGGNVVGYYATLPVKGSTYTIDNSRRAGVLNNTKLTVPTGASYVAISATSKPSVIEDTTTTSEIVDSFESEFDYINGITDAEITFENEGFINASGVFVSNTAYRSTGFIPVSENGSFIPISYRVKGTSATCIAFFDGQNQLIKAMPIGTTSSLEEKTGTIEYVSGSVYARICTYVGSGSIAYSDYYARYGTIKNTVTGIIPYPTDYQGSEISVFNKILCIGDSLTAGTFNYRVGSSTSNYVEDAKYSYPAYLKKISGVDTVNMGNGGKTSLEWYQLHQNDDLSGYDCAIIQLGVNDVGRYGTWGQDSIDGFTAIINKLKTENKNIKIFVANIIPARSYHAEGYINMSSAISAFITGLDDPQVILLDMQQYGHTYDSAAYNCGHLSALGYWRLAQDYKSYISWHIFMNKTDFKEVQFIGTDYYYDPIT